MNSVTLNITKFANEVTIENIREALEVIEAKLADNDDAFIENELRRIEISVKRIRSRSRQF